MKFFTIIPASLALAFVLLIALGASAENAPLVHPQGPTRTASPSPSSGDPIPSSTPTVPTSPPIPERTPTESPEVLDPTPPEPEEPAEPEPPANDPPDGDASSSQAIWTLDGAWIGMVTSETLNIRQAPSLASPIIRTTWARHLVTVYDRVSGDAVDGTRIWYHIGPEQYVSAALVEAFVPPAPMSSYPGHWVDVNLSAFYVVAYEGATPVYAAIIRTGKPGYETPAGVFTIQARVESETMDAGTLGVAPGDPEYYYIADVPYTQYFAAGGYALHGNTWTDPTLFGQPGSHGCVNLLPVDAAWLWSFLDDGSMVSVHS